MGDFVPADISGFYSRQPEMRLGASYPAFSNFSGNRNPGNGEKDQGDIVGWMNRGLCWTDLVETEEAWTIRLHLEGDFLPSECTVDLTPRRLTRFRIAPNEILLANDRLVKADGSGLLTIPGIRLSAGGSVDIQIHRFR